MKYKINFGTRPRSLLRLFVDITQKKLTVLSEGCSISSELAISNKQPYSILLSVIWCVVCGVRITYPFFVLACLLQVFVAAMDITCTDIFQRG